MDSEEEDIFSGFRFVRVVFLKHPHANHGPLDDMLIPINSTSTFRDIQTELDEAKPGQWKILETTFGPVPYWRVPMSEFSRIGANCQILYAVDGSKYVLAVVRASHNDYPIALDPSDLQDLFKAITATAPELKTITKAITGYPTIGLIQDNIAGHIEEQRDKPHFPTVFVITTHDRPDQFQFDSEPRAETPSLRLLYIECKDLLRESYNIKHYGLQMIHVSSALLHAVVSLSRLRKTVDSPTMLTDNLEAYSRMLTGILEEADNDNLNPEVGTRIQRTVNNVFLDLCGDYPGAVTIRDSHVVFGRLQEFDKNEETRLLAQIPTLKPGNRISKFLRCLRSERRGVDTVNIGPKPPL